MNTLEKAAELNRRYAEFIDSCDSREESTKWDVEQRGQMEMYIANELTCILLRLSASDGIITDEEAALYNTVMGTEYSTAELKDIYDSLSDAINSYSVEGIVADMNTLKDEFPELAADYAVIVCDACELLVGSDGLVSEDEVQTAKDLMAAIGI